VTFTDFANNPLPLAWRNWPSAGRLAKLRHFLPLADLWEDRAWKPACSRVSTSARRGNHNETHLCRPGPAISGSGQPPILQVYLPRIEACVRSLSPEQIWWRANPASNSVGNLALHLEGNVRQWIVSGLGGAPDRRPARQRVLGNWPNPPPYSPCPLAQGGQ